jgi:hypothetical protein
LLEGFTEWHPVKAEELKQIKRLVPLKPGLYEWGCGLAQDVQAKVDATERRHAAAAAGVAAAAAATGGGGGGGPCQEAAAGSISNNNNNVAQPDRTCNSSQQLRILCFYLGKTGK